VHLPHTDIARNAPPIELQEMEMLTSPVPTSPSRPAKTSSSKYHPESVVLAVARSPKLTGLSASLIAPPLPSLPVTGTGSGDTGPVNSPTDAARANPSSIFKGWVGFSPVPLSVFMPKSEGATITVEDPPLRASGVEQTQEANIERSNGTDAGVKPESLTMQTSSSDMTPEPVVTL
jgi:hypothetical protein